MDLGDSLRIIPGTSAQVGQQTKPVCIPSTKPVCIPSTEPVYTPPNICLVTHPRLNQNVETIDLMKPETEGLSSCVKAKAKRNYETIYYVPQKIEQKENLEVKKNKKSCEISNSDLRNELTDLF